jgi:hypothetical protein
MGGFDPIAAAKGARSHRFYPPTPAHLPRFGEHGVWQAGTEALIDVLSGWWVGEPRRFDDVLAQAWEWLSLPDSEGSPWGDPPLAWEARHRHARAVAAYMLGREDPRLWAEAAAAIERARSEGAAEPFVSLGALQLCRCMAQGDAAEFSDPRADPLLQPIAAEGAELLTARPDLEPATLYFYAFGRLASVAPPELCLLFTYVAAPELPLPPALLERGWSDATEARLRLGRDPDFDRLERLLLTLGLSRDPDSAPQPKRPTFASWTKKPGLELEADWHAPDGAQPWLEVRGAGAGRAAAALAEAFGTEPAPAPEAALAELLTIPPAAPSGGTGNIRWEILSAVVRAAPGVERKAAEPLVEAGLRDPDWRVRMTAVWGVGALGIARLADSAASTPLPPLGFEGLNPDDRRTLLALRDSAADRAAGRNPAPSAFEGGGPGGANRAAFVARIAALFDGLPSSPRDRHEALVMALLRTPAPERSRIPPAWRSWMA